MDGVIAAYDEAWNTRDDGQRRRLLERSLAVDAQLVDPTAGRVRGLGAVNDRIAGFAERFPGARVNITTGIDEHNAFARYGWTITGPDGEKLLEGIDVIERAEDGRIQTVVMFFGELPGRT